MESGGLVSDDIILEMVRKQLREPECSRGAIFDGFPRTLPQAEGLDRMLSEEGYAIKKAVDFVIDDNLLAERIVNRRVHLPSGRTYNLKSNPPKVEGKDDFTGEDLVQRKDDTLEVFQSRMKSYHEMTKPLISYYSE